MRSYSSSTRSRGSGPNWRSSSSRFLRPKLAQPRAASSGCCRASDPVAHTCDHCRQREVHELGGRHGPDRDARPRRPVEHAEVPHRYAEDQETQVGRALREGDAARVLWCPQHHDAKDEAEQVVGVAPYREVIEKGDAHVDTPYHAHQPKEWCRDVVPAQEREPRGCGQASLECAPGLLAGDVVTRADELEDVRDLAGALELGLVLAQHTGELRIEHLAIIRLRGLVPVAV